ncbi:glycoside hydrolase family 89 protein, partial [Phlebopus sp. FC_14]
TATAQAAQNDSDTQLLAGIRALVERRIPQHADSFHFALTPSNASQYPALDTFTLVDASPDGGILIECSTVSACARGLYTYVTELGGVDIWWTGSRLDQLPSHLPAIGNTPITRSAIVPYRYFLNTVTFDYTTTFFTGDDWELLLDWMALRGVNLPLAWVGYEHTLVEVFREVGVSEDDIFSFLSAPAFQAWNRLGNIQGSWNGPIPSQWIDDQFALQTKIIPRMVALGMTPVLPSFTGFVPRTMQQLYPNASIVNGSQWVSFPVAYTNVSFLEPFDPLFTQMQISFLSKQREAFGNVSHIYTLDQYNENNPYSGDTSYLASIANATFASLRAADPEAIWMMQGWLFFAAQSFWTTERVEAYLGGVSDNNGMIVLDLFSEVYPQWDRLDSYYGKPWVWCQVHDFGGSMGMEGSFENVTVNPLEALASPGSTMVGMGLTPEGLVGDEFIFDVLLDQAWSLTPLNKTAYATAWAQHRYYIPNLPSGAVDAWNILASTVYSNTDPNVLGAGKSVIELRPSIQGLLDYPSMFPTTVPYDTNTTIVPALTMLLKAGEENPDLVHVPEYRRDIVDLTRQLLTNRFLDMYTHLLGVYNASSTNASDIRTASRPMLSLIADLDDILLSNSHFRLDTQWTRAARRMALTGSDDGHDNGTYAAYLESVARTQITTWGPPGALIGLLNDYASKQWGGIVGTYYVARWEYFLGYLEEVKRSGGAYDDTVVLERTMEMAREWCLGTDGDDVSDEEAGDSIGLAWALLSKYG